MNAEAEYIINTLNLSQHPEGGWYRETWRSLQDITVEQGDRSLATAIYFLLAGKEVSTFHRLSSDEFWYFHQGTKLELFLIHPDGKLEKKQVGPVEENCQPQILMPAGCWFAARCVDSESFSLVSCSVHPGFDFADFEMAKRDKLTELYPQHRKIIAEFCPE